MHFLFFPYPFFYLVSFKLSIFFFLRKISGFFRFYRLPSVLVPGLDLRVSQVERRRQVHAVLHAEVFLPLEAALQLVELVVGEGSAGFAGFFRAHRWTVSATGDLPVPFLFSACAPEKKIITHEQIKYTPGFIIAFNHRIYNDVFFPRKPVY